MLPTSVSFERAALNRVTFGATPDTETAARQVGWSAWVEQQLGVTEDDSALAQHLATQTMRIKYGAADPNGNGTWDAVDGYRPLNYLNADAATLWHIGIERGRSVSPAETTRAIQETVAATWIRNTHATGQLREFMADFWHNHFNIGKAQNPLANAPLPLYDRVTIRPNVFGNFRQMLEANATSPSMLVYLDNWLSAADHPNENYAREIAELHTLGAGAYVGILAAGKTVPLLQSGIAQGFTDDDIIQNARALSGWTVGNGQRVSNGVRLPVTGAFAYNAAQHNTAATRFMNVDLSAYSAPLAQGRKVMDILAYHPTTANFIVGKLARRIFGDLTPGAVINRAVAAWNANLNAPNQIAKVLEAMLLDGPEVGTYPASKIRRPYERLIAMFRTAGMVVNASSQMYTALDPVNDGLFAWLGPNGRPDVNSYWSGTAAQMTSWNLAQSFPATSQIVTSLASQTPASVLASANLLVEYWVGRMVGYEIPAMAALIDDQMGSAGVLAALHTGKANKIETAYRRLVALITTTRDFVYR